MNDGKINGIIKKKTGKLSELAKNVCPGFDIDIIHDLRVNAKELRSFLRLLRTHTHEPKLKLTKEFKKLYHIAGIIREAQLELEQFAKQQLFLPHYANNLHRIIIRQKKEWEKCYDKKIFQKLEARICGQKYGDMPVRVLTDFINTNLNVIEETSNTGSLTDTHVHNIRKRVKDIIYLSKLGKKKWDAAHKEIAQMPLQQLEEIAADIGDYHDRLVTFEHLRSFSKRQVPRDEQNTVMDICDQDALMLQEEKIRIAGEVASFIATGKT